jgi:hypothetical protein
LLACAEESVKRRREGPKVMGSKSEGFANVAAAASQIFVLL